MDFSSLSEQSLRTSRLYLRAGSSLMIRTDHVGAKSPRHVRREKALVDCGCKSRPGTGFAPPGSNPSGGGGNEAVGASGVEGHIGDLASMQAVT
jgi:hypothetical protein